MIVFFDIDGTLITEDASQYLPQSTVLSIQAIRRNGHYAFINTGRTKFNVIHQPYVQRIGFDGYVCACGAHILYNSRDIFSVTVPESLHAVILSAARSANMELMLEGPEAFYFDHSLPMCPERKRLYQKDPARSLSADLPGKCFNKFVTWDTPASRPDDFIAAVSPWFTAIDRGKGFREFCPNGCSKATGIAKIAELLQQPLSDCIVIGDSMNDLPMLEYVTHSVLMGNGHPALRSKVEFVTKDIRDDGIAYALSHYHLL